MELGAAKTRPLQHKLQQVTEVVTMTLQRDLGLSSLAELTASLKAETSKSPSKAKHSMQIPTASVTTESPQLD